MQSRTRTRRQRVRIHLFLFLFPFSFDCHADADAVFCCSCTCGCSCRCVCLSRGVLAPNLTEHSRLFSLIANERGRHALVRFVSKIYTNMEMNTGKMDPTDASAGGVILLSPASVTVAVASISKCRPDMLYGETCPVCSWRMC